MRGYPVVAQAPELIAIPIVENTWIDISAYVGKLIYFTASAGTNAYVEFSNDGISPIPSIQKMDLNPSTWASAGAGANEWSTNYPARYIRFPSVAALGGAAAKLYGSFSPIERKVFSIVKEESFGPLSGVTVLGEELAHDPFVQRTTIDGEPNGVQAVLAVEYAGKRSAGGVWVMHTPPVLMGTGGTLAFLNFTGTNADNAVILAPSQKVCAYFNRVSIYCTAGTVDVDIRSQQFGTWNAAVALRKQSDNILVTQLVAGEIGILENVAFESLQVLQKGAVASNANVIFSDPLRESVPFIDLGAYSGAVAITPYSGNVTINRHTYY